MPLFTQALDCLKASERYGDRFADLETEPSPDGLGVVLTQASLWVLQAGPRAVPAR